MRLRWPVSGGLVDLTRDSSFLLQLLDDTWLWRQRLAESLELGAGEHIQVTSRYQIEFPPALVQPFVRRREPSHVRALVPVALRDKRPLLQFEASGPGGAPAALLLRSSIAALQAKYLSKLIESSPAAAAIIDSPSLNLLEAICVFTPGVAKKFETASVAGMTRYLAEGLARDVPPAAVEEWLSHQHSVGEILADVLGEPADPYSSSENVLLALPRMDPRPASLAEVTQLVNRYTTTIRTLREAHDSVLLEALAEYGRRYEAIVETEVPVGRPVQITLREDRPLGRDTRGWCTQRIAAGDARTFHLEVTSTDPVVEIARYDVRDLEGKPYAIPRLEAVRDTPESLALYSAESDRPYCADVRIRLRPIIDVRVTTWLVQALAVMAVFTAAAVPASDDLINYFALLAVPTTFAVALVLVREESTLASILQRRGRVLLCVATGALWLIIASRLLVGY